MSDDEYGGGVGDNYDYGGGGFGDEAYVRVPATLRLHEPNLLARTRTMISLRKRALVRRGRAKYKQTGLMTHTAQTVTRTWSMGPARGTLLATHQRRRKQLRNG